MMSEQETAIIEAAAAFMPFGLYLIDAGHEFATEIEVYAFARSSNEVRNQRTSPFSKPVADSCDFSLIRRCRF